MSRFPTATVRWKAKQGKLDRCQLGDWSQLERAASLQETECNLVAKSTEQPQQLLNLEDAAKPSEFLSMCKSVLSSGSVEDFKLDALRLLLNEAKNDTCAAVIIRNLGFTVRDKFKDDFDLREACRLSYICQSSILDDLSDCIRTGCNLPRSASASLYYLATIMYT